MSQLPFLSHGFVTHLLFPPWFSTERLLLDLPQYDVVHPTRVDARGHFLSNFLSHHARRVQRREAPEGSANMDRVFYQLWHSNHSLRFNLTLNTHLLAPGFLTERRYGGLEGAKMQTAASSQCHFLGEVWDEDSVKGSAAISTCDGLVSTVKFQWRFKKNDVKIIGLNVCFCLWGWLDVSQCRSANAAQEVDTWGLNEFSANIHTLMEWQRSRRQESKCHFIPA